MAGHSLALLLLSVLRHCLQFCHESIWPGESRHCACMGEGHHPVRTVWGRGAAWCMKMSGTSQTLTSALIGSTDPGAVDSCKSNSGHWVEPQTTALKQRGTQQLLTYSEIHRHFSKISCNIYCMSVFPPLWLFLRFLFSLLKRFFFFNMASFSSLESRFWGQRVHRL